jgi:hypothetical protein
MIENKVKPRKHKYREQNKTAERNAHITVKIVNVDKSNY